jgi:hypothetical protein
MKQFPLSEGENDFMSSYLFFEGVLRSGDVIADMGSLDSCDTHLSTDSARPRLNPLTDVIHTADLQIPLVELRNISVFQYCSNS